MSPQALCHCTVNHSNRSFAETQMALLMNRCWFCLPNRSCSLWNRNSEMVISICFKILIDLDRPLKTPQPGLETFGSSVTRLRNGALSQIVIGFELYNWR